MKNVIQSADYPTRRRMLAMAAKSCLGVGLLATGNFSFAGAQAARAKAKHVIYLYLAGGMSHIDTFDPKPGQETAGEFSPIKTNVNGIQIGEHLPRVAGQMDKICVLRSMTSSQGAHERGNYLMHTSYAPLGTVQHASIGAWTVKLAGRPNEKLPGHVLVGGGNRNPGGGFLGSQYEPLRLGKPSAGLQNVDHHGGNEEFEKRMSLMNRLDASFRSRYAHKKVQAYNEFYQEAVAMMQSEDVKAFDIAQEPESIRQSYGEDQFGQGCLLARRLVENGVRFVEVTSGGWDTHQDNFERLGERLLPTLDQAVAALLADLASRGLLDETLVVLTTEFGRTPRVNQRAGRDHYPKVFSSLLAGGGVKGGQIYGQSTADGSAVKDNPVTPAQLNATIAHAMGLDYTKSVFTSIGRPFTLSNEAKPVTAIF